MSLAAAEVPRYGSRAAALRAHWAATPGWPIGGASWAGAAGASLTAKYASSCGPVMQRSEGAAADAARVEADDVEPVADGGGELAGGPRARTGGRTRPARRG